MHWYKLFVYALMGYGVLMLFYFMLNQPPASGSSNEARTQLQAQIEELEARHQLISQKLKEWQLNKKVEMTQELEKALKAELEEQPVSQPLEPKSETGRQVLTYTPPENLMGPSVLVVGGTDGSGTRYVAPFFAFSFHSFVSFPFILFCSLVGAWWPSSSSWASRWWWKMPARTMCMRT